MTHATIPRPGARAGVRRQRGMTLFGLVFWAVVICFLGLMAIRVWPSLNEYFTIRQAIDRISRTDPAPGDVGAVRKAFDRQKEIEYSITTLNGSDLQVEPSGDGRFRISFAYDKEIEVIGPVYLLIKYRGSSR